MWLTLKLFTLMGGTWLMEFVTWALEEEGLVATVFDSINILRGPIIFYLCVIGNTKVRRAIVFRLKQKATQASQMSRSTFNSDFVSGSGTTVSISERADTAL